MKCIVDATDADIVISSDWRFSGFDSMQKMWNHRKLPGNIVGITPFLKEKNYFRGNEIKKYLDDNYDIDKYLIIDDNSDFNKDQLPFLIKTNPKYGLSFNDVLKGIKILNN